MTPAFSDLRERLPDLMLRDQRRLRRRIDGARKVRDAAAREGIAAEIAADVEAAEARVVSRRARLPPVRYPQALPISERTDEIRAAVRDHQVVIVAGETGSGKTTQLPKICLELGRGVHGLIGHTQPRRLAARTVAERVAEELDTPVGGTVGYKVRFTDQVGDDTLVKQMTDGILLAELQHDRRLRQYDTLIIDEAHERSLNIDFILGYLNELLPRRPDLKVIITSATIDPHRFARHFGSEGEPAPVIEVSGRTYPVEVRYRPLTGDAWEDAEDGDDTDDTASADDRDQTEGICDAVDELRAEGPGDILVFCSGEREIRDTADALGKRNLSDTEILPLYARLSAADQQRVFHPHGGPTRRRIVLATNVAETSLTVPGIKYVIDPGTARISRYSHRTKVQRLPIERISQASANQRKGRCGRISAGICIRLYSEEDFLSRPEFTDPEILRTNLASVILQMAAAGLGDISTFPFLDPPDRRQIKAGSDLLKELGAFEPAGHDGRPRLTKTGRKLAGLPVDPRMGRMVLEAERYGCVHDATVIAAALSIQDPRERPADHQGAADERHARFADKTSDFLAYLHLWNYLQEQQRHLSGNQFRKLCKAEFLNYRRVREWQDLYGQLRQVSRNLGIARGAAGGSTKHAAAGAAPGSDADTAGTADAQRVHISVLAGLLSHIGRKEGEKGEYLGARNAKFAIFPGSALFKNQPRWVMSAELVETSRLWGRVNAGIEPEWVEQLAGHLVKRTYSEPHWDERRGAVMAYEKVTLYGIPIVASRKVTYGRIDPETSRELFIRHALVQGEWDTHHEFFHHNRRLLEEVRDLEHRARRRDIVVDDETLFDFYDQRVGSEVVSTRHFDKWWRKVRRSQPDLLTFPRSMLVNPDTAGVSESDYPDLWEQDGLRLDLSYQFEPGSGADGVTVNVPLPVLNQLSGAGFDWQVPGLREELVTALIKSMPKAYRRSFVPAPDYAKAILDRVTPKQEPLVDAVRRELHRMGGVEVPRDAFDLDRVPDHLKMCFRIADEHGRVTAEGRDLPALQSRLQGEMRTSLSGTASDLERTGLDTWDIGTLPQTVEHRAAGHTVRAHPALVDETDSVAVRVLNTEAEQQRAMWTGTRRLLLLNVSPPITFIQGRFGNQAKLALSNNPHGSVADLLNDCAACAVDALMDECGGPAWDEEGFGKLLDHVRGELGDALIEIVTTVERVLRTAHQLGGQLASTTSPALAPAVTDMRDQVADLVYPGFVTATGRRRLPDLARYLEAVQHRLAKLAENPRRDAERMAEVQRLEESYDRLLEDLPPGAVARAEEIRWMLEELRVSYFAQTLGTPYRVSEKRVRRAMDELTP